ncbi:hypothetical protein EW026_g4180 [Hermanssonia centrifuga]|uniref:Defective in cullin neddylation protein n=1 Tax=Hermanssonia centrifuga TaxID=98765 RepID=A0A4S4KHZ0_9APHY|nr:hypothetical protein EW026_g4180 [Hermanssonia centrifuga]
MDPQTEEKIAQFCAVTGASQRDAKRYLEKHNKRVDLAIDAFYNEPVHPRQTTGAPSTSKLNLLFDNYKDPDGDEITVDGTIKMCQDLKVDPEDVVLLSVAYELKSPRLGEWTRKGWVDGWKSIGCDGIPTMQTSLLRLRDRLGSDAAYFQQVYNYAFEFSRPPVMDMAQGFWGLLIPHGLQGGALSHIATLPGRDNGEDVRMGAQEEGWNDELTQWWFEYLTEKGIKGVSKDVWQMFLEFVRTVDSKFEKYDLEGQCSFRIMPLAKQGPHHMVIALAAWPSTIDDFVEYARARLSSGQ